MMPERSIRLLVTGSLLWLLVGPGANAACTNADIVFVSQGEHGERVFSDTPAGGDESQLTLGCRRAPDAQATASTAADMLELALVLAEDRRAESEQRRAQRQARDERRASAVNRVAENPRDRAAVSERLWVHTYPYRLDGRHKRQPRHSHSPIDSASPTPTEPAGLSKRFPVRQPAP